MKKEQYFKTETFVENVIDALHLHDKKSAHANGVRAMVRDALRTRLLEKLFLQFNEREMALFKQIEKDHPELEPLDVLMMMLHNVDWLEKTLEMAINELHIELLEYARMVAEASDDITDDVFE